MAFASLAKSATCVKMQVDIHKIRDLFMSVEPTALTLQSDGKLVIKWSDGRRRRYDPAELRRKCPCATCLHERGAASRTVGLSDKPAPVTIAQMHTVGNYAYNIQFNDAHTTGIFSLEMLLEMGEVF